MMANQQQDGKRSPNAISIDGLSLSIGKSQLLDNVSLRVKQDSMTAIIGANGAGKTTLLKCLLGLLKPNAGRIEVNGMDVKSYSRTELAHELAYVPQLLEASVPFTVLDFVMMGRYAHEGGFGYRDKDGEKIANTALERVHMSGFAQRTLQTLSGGERQKVCIAAALAQQTPILILDEPSAHLDPRQREEVHSLLTDIAKNDGLSILTVTHDLNWAGIDYDYIFGMKEGRVVTQGSASEVITGESLYALFGVDFTMVPHPETQSPMVIPAIRSEGGSNVKH